MPEFQFSARDASGQQVTGRRNALSAEDLAAQLQTEALTPLDISKAEKKTEKPAGSSLKITIFKEKVSQDDLQMLCRQLYTLIKAGIPIGISIAKLAETTRDKQLAKALQQILASLNQGRSLYLSLAQFPDIFSDFFVNLVKVGESTGQLDNVFLHLAEYLELEVDTRKKIKSALRYPLMVLVAIFVALLIINAFVIPAFAGLFKSFQGTLPLPTRILIATSDFIIGYWYIILAGIILAIVAIRYYIKTTAGELKWSRLQLKIPVIGWLIHRIILARFASLYALVLRSGLTAVDGIELVGASTGNAFVEQQIRQVSSMVGRGNSIANSIAQTQLFPPLVVQMITLGEESGNIDTLLDDVAEFYQREIEYDLVRLSDAIEPIMLVIMGVMVLILALGVFLPMWSMASQMMHPK